MTDEEAGELQGSYRLLVGNRNRPLISTIDENDNSIISVLIRREGLEIDRYILLRTVGDRK